MDRRASLVASGSSFSLNVRANPRSADRFALDERYLDPAGSLPRVFTDNRACAASATGFNGAEDLDDADNYTFGRELSFRTNIFQIMDNNLDELDASCLTEGEGGS